MGKKVISFLGESQCQACTAWLEVHTFNDQVLSLDDNGNVLKVTDDSPNTFLMCPRCHAQYDYVIKNGKYVVYTDLQQRLDIYNMIERGIDEKIPNNPFVKEV